MRWAGATDWVTLSSSHQALSTDLDKHVHKRRRTCAQTPHTLSHTCIHYEHTLIRIPSRADEHTAWSWGFEAALWKLITKSPWTTDSPLLSTIRFNSLQYRGLRRSSMSPHIYLQVCRRIHVAHFCFPFHGLKGFPLGYDCNASPRKFGEAGRMGEQ